MITPEYLKQYKIFSVLSPDQLRHIAEFAEKVSHDCGDILFYEGDRADSLYVLMEGLIELYYTVDVEYHPELYKELKFREIQPGELFSISAMIEPYVLTASARAVEPSRMIKIQSAQLLEWCEENYDLANAMMRQVASAAITRLQATREQLGAARAAFTI